MKDIKGGGTCRYLMPTGDIVCRSSKQEALYATQGVVGAHWCCDSCPQTWYCVVSLFL